MNADEYVGGENLRFGTGNTQKLAEDLAALASAIGRGDVSIKMVITRHQADQEEFPASVLVLKYTRFRPVLASAVDALSSSLKEKTCA